MKLRQAAKWILSNTIVSDSSLTPSIKLRLITEQTPLWMSTPDLCPLPDPYWAFYWPGGQGVTKYILENPNEFQNETIFDFGAGCGSISIAGCLVGCKSVIANDIDPNALIATKLNFKLNGISDEKVKYSSTDFLNPSNHSELLEMVKGRCHVILGDMFYDSEFTAMIFEWLRRLKENRDVRILVGDPDRHPLTDPKYLERYPSFTKTTLAQYPLPAYVIKEHYGFNIANIYEFRL
ncbi:unnamed protein product [Auanema sp. JU1783]|nr:unnamed protein product [Auanema sp. JU1783]